MRPFAAAVLIGLVIVAGGAWATYERCPGCIDRSRINRACEWAGDTAFPIDAGNAAHQEHLVGDAHIAEELAIRYADREFGRRFGVEHHGGLLEGGRTRNECLSRMLHAIETTDGVTREQVHLTRGRRNRAFDVAVIPLFLPPYLLAAIAASRWLSRRFSSDERFARLVAIGMASLEPNPAVHRLPHPIRASNGRSGAVPRVLLAAGRDNFGTIWSTECRP